MAPLCLSTPSACSLSSVSSRASTAPLRSAAVAGAAPCARAAPLRIDCAINRETKEKIVKKIQDNLEGSMLCMGLRYKDMPVKTVEKIRRRLPKETTMYVAKNSLMRIATRQEGFTAWAPIAECTFGDNVWIFAKEEQVADTMKAYLEIEKEAAKEFKNAGNQGALAELSGGVMDGQYLTAEKLKQLDKMPTKKDLIAKIGMGIRAVPTKIGRGIKEVPTKLARAVKALSDEENPDRSALVGDVFPKAK